MQSESEFFVIAFIISFYKTHSSHKKHQRVKKAQNHALQHYSHNNK